MSDLPTTNCLGLYMYMSLILCLSIRATGHLRSHAVCGPPQFEHRGVLDLLSGQWVSPSSCVSLLQNLYLAF